MLFRALILALTCACTCAHTPLSAAGDDNDCALYLSGPGRTSAYDYSLNLLRGNFGYEGQHTCVTYDAVNQAYLDARKRILVSQPKGDWKAEDYASVGELVLDISINLARTYGLTYEEIEKGLPLIDTSRTLIREVCPPVFSHVECRPGKYRRLDGLCNNLQNPTWGSTMAPFQRLIGPLFSDGINSPRISHTGRDLPLSRVVSRTMHPDEGFHDHAGTVMVIAWGQFMDHDYTLTGTPLDPRNRNDPEECCKRPPHLKHPYCNEIRIPDDDYFYRLFGVKCIDFVRGFPSPRPGCRLGSRVPFNTLTGVIDGNTIYGVTEKFARKLRTGYGGLLRMNPVFKEYGLKDLLPLKLDIPDEGCTRPNKNMYCFEAGEIRVNEQLVLTVMHTLMAREHNRIAGALAAVNPHWDDETLFQESRRINIAEIQHITYNEFLPILLGKDVMEKFGLVLEKEGYWEGHDPHVNPDVIDAFAAAAYRFGHSLLPTAVERWSKAHKFIASKRLSDLIRRPYDLYRAGVLDEYVMGLMNQVAQAMDDSITQEVTNHLFKKVGARFGMDLVSFNMQRGREFGLPGYMEFRKFCGLSGAETFQELFGAMPNETVRKYETIFEHPIDVDLWSGGVSERPLPGSMLGPTFACIIATQFSYSRRGDRFWYELPHQPSSFTHEQLKEVRKARLARVICDNTDIIDTTQLYPFVLPDHELNPRVPCKSGIIPSIDFSKWAEPPPFTGSAKQFITDAQIQVKNETDVCNNTQDNISDTPCNKNETDLCNNTQDNVSDTPCNKNETDVCNNTQDNVSDTPCNKNETDVCNNTQDNVSDTLCNKNETDVCNNTQDNVSDTPCNKNETDVCNNTQDNVSDTPCNKNQLHNSTDNASVVQESIDNLETNKTAEIETLHVINEDIKADTNNTNSSTKEPVVKSDTVMKYVYRKNEKPEDAQKSAGHLKNSLKRKKRSIDPSKFHKLAPIIVDYETSHNQQNKQNFSPSTRHAQQYIKASDLNDFSIQTLHDDIREANLGIKAPIQEIQSKLHLNNEKTHPASKESAEINSDTSEDLGNYNNKEHKDDDNFAHSKSQKNNKEENESLEYNKTGAFESKENVKEASASIEELPDDSDEYVNEKSNYKKNTRKDTNDDRSDSRENYSSNESNDKSNFKKPQSNEHESGEKEVFNSNEEIFDSVDKINKDSKEDKPVRDSVEINESKNNDAPSDKTLYNRWHKQKQNIKTSTPPEIQYVDLGDFSYERIQVNDKGKVEPAKDHHANDEKDPSDEDEHVPKTEKYRNSDINQYPKKNKGEVKPVIEINKESDDSSEEREESVETLQNTPNDESSEEKSSKIKNKSSGLTLNQINAKQELERIPLDYKHDKKPNKNSKSTSKVNSEEEAPSKTDKEVSHDNAPSPKDTQYDEHLNIKFDDIALTLPEIKLPEDVIAYKYEEEQPPKNKKKFYTSYNEEDDEEEDKNAEEKPKEEENDGRDHDHYKGYDGNYYGKGKASDDYRRAPHDDSKEDHDVDLYEKFVRERFGKKGSFEKRSEKLQQDRFVPTDPQLYDTISRILKKTEETAKEAAQAKDPNAGYMWTLEYGEKL